MSDICKKLSQQLKRAFRRPEQRMQLFGERYVVERELGEGATANVLLLRQETSSAQSDVLFALKVICTSTEKRRVLEAEISAHDRVRGSPLVLELLRSEISHTRNADVLEARLLFPYCDGGTVLAALDSKRATSSSGFTQDEAVHIFEQIASAVAHCHGCGVIHRDIKLTNVYLRTSAGTQKWVLGDFGSALLSAQPVHISDRTLLLCAREEVDELTTPEYRAPEQVSLELGSTLTSAVDAWALGVALHQLVLDCNPFATPLATLSARSITSKELACSSGLQELLSGLLERDAGKRLSSFQAAERARAIQQQSSVVPLLDSNCELPVHDKDDDGGWAHFEP
mmetsp:Transcript_40445/g.86267  ORF Transcript_40445/g.86267 Transcript_40445/m.86267 type:complete len:341 (-) Transcript_40445:487-1509(-)|eukprot:CAMPEP_0183331532 /NCGR_PEP_ID=MMETSP0164_2-20130417/896_1 /TAXON_ID=221442 /ORGANISM="Coccolithus pelagicus ssp braarudi, Strain PLY182g" /LENGTH=340 /DNA_ID=CAMNT_0025500035 /DNA_START=67 /DNA_END=1089 /DNA_ORIENTATION=+